MGELEADERLWQRIEKLEASKERWKYLALALLFLMVMAGVMRYAPRSGPRQSPFIAEPE